MFFTADKNLASEEGLIRILTSNILAVGPGLVTKLTQEERVVSLCEHYIAYKPDFIGLQEMQMPMKPIIQKELKDVYEFLETDEVFEIDGKSFNCTPLIYRKDLYEPIENKFISFNHGSLWNCEWGLYRRKTDSKKIIHMNIHYHLGSEIEDATVVNGELKNLVEKYKDVPIFVTGDYNSQVDTPIHEAMTEGLEIKSGMLLTDDNDGYGATCHQPDCNIYADVGAIDHVYVTYKNAEVVRHRNLTSDLIVHSSDHNIVFIDVRI